MGVFKKGNNWYIDYYILGRRKREKVGPNKAQARVVLQKRKVQIAERKFLDVQRHQKVRFGEMVRLYIKTYSKPNKRSSWRDKISLGHLKSLFGAKCLHEVTPLDVEKYKVERLKKVAPATVNRELACLKHMFNKAIEWGKAKENPARKVKLLREENRRVRYLEKEETKALLETCPPHLKPIVITALNTGMRKGEILTLKWSQVDLVHGIIYIHDTKSGRPREVYINEWLLETLLELSEHRRGSYVFCDERARPYGSIRKSFETAKRKAGIEDLRFHDLRHNVPR